MPATRQLLCLVLPVALAGAVVAALAQPVEPDPVAATRDALARARSQGEAARSRAIKLEAEAARVTQAAEKTAREAAAVAARIQQSEAEIAGHEARIRLIEAQRVELSRRLAERQRPLVRLTAALQRLSRRPLILSLLQPGSVEDTMHLRAMLDTLLPEVERRTAALRGELGRGRVLQAQAVAAAGDLRAGEGELEQRRRTLAALESRQRLASRAASGTADRESERALALAEEARDLGVLVQDLASAGALRERLARLPGPLLRPPRPSESQVVVTEIADPTPAPTLSGYILPVQGRLIAGFGDAAPGELRSRGIVLAPRPGAQAVAPAPGRVAFAGPYRGYGQIVIIDHGRGWTSLVTGLARLDAAVGEEVVAGSPLGTAAPVDPRVTVELRSQGEPVNPLEAGRG
jgi:murein hydrolase activator